MSLFNELISIEVITGEIQKMLKKYKNSGHVTEENVIDFTMDRLKIFGNNVMADFEDVIPISGYNGELPSNVFRINEIYKCHECKNCDEFNPCEDDTCDTCKPKPEPMLQKTFKWVETNKYRETHDACDSCEPEIETIVGCERTYIPDIARFKVHGRQPLYLGKMMSSGLCTQSCKGCHHPDSPFRVDVEGNTIKTSFRDGNIYIQYYGIPLDGQGRPLIQNSKRGFVYEHIKYYVLYKILEYIIIEDETAVTMYRLMRENAELTKRQAVVDAKASTFSNQAYYNLIFANRANTQQYHCLPKNFNLKERYKQKTSLISQ